MGIKQHNGNTKADRLAELKIRSPSIQLIKFGAIGLNAIIFSPLLIAADTGSQYGTNITINDGDGNDSNLLIVFYVQIMPDD
ncbi:hypothetical protein, partial [Escherichia coli]|uniref:hypothetical protein n=1 Tax=Escherichia coli TaxID=562 RepID=UPI001F1F4C5C